MQRGKRKLQTLTNTIAPEQQAVLFPADEQTMYEKKVSAIVARYYYFVSKETRYDEMLVKLSEEFFLSTGRIADILAAKETEIIKLRQSPPPKKWFQTNWSHIIW